MKRTVLSAVIATAVLLAAPGAFAQTVQAGAKADVKVAGVGAGVGVDASAKASSPSQLVLANSTRILNTLEARRAEFSKNRTALRQFVASEFNALFDRDYAARLVLGVHGRGAAEADVKLFADALADSLMQRYGSSLLDFNAKLKVRVKSETPLRGGAIVKVSSEYLRAGGEPIPVDYLMRKTGSSWKVFDVMVEGVSFVQTFRNQFDTPLKQKPIAQVAAELKAGKLQADASN